MARIGLLLVVAPFAAVLGAGAARTKNAGADFHFGLSRVVLALLSLLHRIQRKNNRAIEKKLDELMDRKEGAAEKVS
jgi:hypothetical protein